ncbi:DUF7742 family protein [Pontibaca methylaminivorans]|uniref:DUF7742 family protein n=1 Tax=Pontibaca methylaminivorans TaxID=515897 RepID=UPI002FD9A5AB
MRRILHGDVSNTARALYGTPPEGRAALLRHIFRQAEAADIRLRSTGTPHPRWGNGTLMAAARRHTLPPEPGFDDRDYCRCFLMVLQALLDRKT